MDKSDKARDELNAIESRQREWNALSAAERASVAKASPDLSLFFRRGLAKIDRRAVVAGNVIDLVQTPRAMYRRRAHETEGASCGLEGAQSPARSRKIRRFEL